MGFAAARWVLLGAACLLAAAAALWMRASTYSISARKGTLIFLAYLLGGLGICLGASTGLVLEWRLPRFEAAGTIESVNVHGEGKGYRTNLNVHLASGGDLALNADSRSPYFRPGERVKIHYQGYTGSILKAQFLSASGDEEGVFNGTETWPPYFALLAGLALIWAGVRNFRRDPEGAREPSSRNPHPYGDIDKASLLDLSRSDD